MRITQLIVLLFQIVSLTLTKNPSDALLINAQRRFDDARISKLSSASIMPGNLQQDSTIEKTFTSTATVTPVVQATATPVYVPTPSPIVIVVPAGPTATPTLIPFPTLNIVSTKREASGEILAVQYQTTTLEMLKNGVLFNWRRIIQLWPFGILIGIWFILGVWFLVSQKND